MTSPYPPPLGDGLVAFGPEANCRLDLCPLEYTVFKYRPSLAVNICFIGLYLSAMCLHMALALRWRSWTFTLGIVAGCLDEMAGYAGRLMLYLNPFSFAGFMMQIVCITTAPVFFCAAIYVTIAKTVEYLDPSLSRIRPKLYYSIFIVCDIISLVLQGVGGSLSTTSTGTSQTAIKIAQAGLGFQVATLFVFCALLADYLTRYHHHHHHHRLRSSGAMAMTSTSTGTGTSTSIGIGIGIDTGTGTGTGTRPLLVRRLGTFLLLQALAILLILARCAYRVDELSDGYAGQLMHNEPLFVGLEGVLIVCAVAALAVAHPGRVFGPADAAGPAVPERFSEETGGMEERK